MTNNNFSSYLMRNASQTLTENGANALGSTGSALLDLFGTVGALRTRPHDVDSMFELAYKENPLLATKLSFYARNVRGGLGEREVSRRMWVWLANSQHDTAVRNMLHIPEFGRWDDIYSFIGTGVEDTAWSLISEQWVKDVSAYTHGQPISLLAKWLKSINTSSAESRKLGKLTAKHLGYSERDYRKTLSMLRGWLKLTEVFMSAKAWDKINYSAVPSKAMANYRKAFGRHDPDGFTKFIENVQKGEAVIHSGTLYPYDIMEKMGLRESYEYGLGRYGNSTFSLPEWDAALEEQWKALPNYVEDGDNVLIVADTSGSMQGRPIATSIGLAVYFAERNKGQFKGQFITFSRKPNFITLTGKTLKDKVKCIPAICENTDLQAVFDLVLDTAVKYHVPQTDMPKSIIIISDMEIDSARNPRGMTFNAQMKADYAQEGYELPNMVYWQVDARQNVFHAEMDEHGVQLASGQSTSIFKAILKNVGFTAYDSMVDVLNDPIYDCITVIKE
jgi:hypothetical protein